MDDKRMRRKDNFTIKNHEASMFQKSPSFWHPFQRLWQRLGEGPLGFALPLTSFVGSGRTANCSLDIPKCCSQLSCLLLRELGKPSLTHVWKVIILGASLPWAKAQIWFRVGQMLQVFLLNEHLVCTLIQP